MRTPKLRRASSDLHDLPHESSKALQPPVSVPGESVGRSVSRLVGRLVSRLISWWVGASVNRWVWKGVGLVDRCQ